MTSPTPIGRQSLNNLRADHAPIARASVAIPQAAGAVRRAGRSQRHHRRDPGRATPPPAASSAMVQVPPTERLPDGIGGPVLRAAALKGDPDRGL